MEKSAYYTTLRRDDIKLHVYDTSVIEVFRLRTYRLFSEPGCLSKTVSFSGDYILEKTIAVTKEEVPATLKEFGF